jgi:outer membrane lipoprotein SlyB
MARIICEQCSHPFEATENSVNGFAAAAAGGVLGATMGSGIGIVAGPLGGIAGTVPGAIVGGLVCGLGAARVVRCPSCGHIFVNL